MKKICFLILLCSLSFFGFAQNLFQYNGFSGGMMVHSGYLQSQEFSITTNNGQPLQTLQAKGVPFGIGGAAKVHLGKHLRVGGEGYVSNLNYGKHNSIFSLSYGGVLVDCVWQNKRFSPYVGVLFGGGSTQNTTLFAPTADDFIAEGNVSYRKNSFLALSPFIGVEYALNDKIRLTLKADYLINLNNPSADLPNGVRVFVGFMFYSLKTE